LADFISIAKLKSRHLISAQHELIKVSYSIRKPTNSSPLLTRNEVEEANKAVAKVLEWKMVQQVLQCIFLKMEH